MDASYPALSSDGRMVAFQSVAATIVPGDTNEDPDAPDGPVMGGDVFVRDLRTCETRRVSIASDGAQGDDESFRPAISGNGRVVAFHSRAGTLMPGDDNRHTDVFVHDVDTGLTEAVSLALDGSPARSAGDPDWGSALGSLSDDGRFVAFWSSASNLTPETAACEGEACELSHAFVRDRQTQTTTLLDVDASGAAGDDYVEGAAVSGDGSVAVFVSRGRLLPTSPSIGAALYGRPLASGPLKLLSETADGSSLRVQRGVPALSQDGCLVVFNFEDGNDRGIALYDCRLGYAREVERGFPGISWVAGDASRLGFWLARELGTGWEYTLVRWDRSLTMRRVTRLPADALDATASGDGRVLVVQRSGRLVAYTDDQVAGDPQACAPPVDPPVDACAGLFGLPRASCRLAQSRRLTVCGVLPPRVDRPLARAGRWVTRALEAEGVPRSRRWARRAVRASSRALAGLDRPVLRSVVTQACADAVGRTVSDALREIRVAVH